MPAVAMIVVGFIAGLFTMTIASFYRWFLSNFRL
jgi:hypothetical protein